MRGRREKKGGRFCVGDMIGWPLAAAGLDGLARMPRSRGR